MTPQLLDPRVWPYLVGGLFVIVLLWAGIVGIRSRQRERRRMEKMRGFASSLEMVFTERDDGIADALGHFSLFQHRSGRKIRTVLRRAAGADDFVVFGYEYTVITPPTLARPSSGMTSTGQYGSSSTTYRYAVFAERIPGRFLPTFQLAPITIGLPQIRLRSSLEFSRQYQLAGTDEAAVRRLFRPEVLQYFAHEAGWSVEGAGEWLIVYQESWRVVPEELAGLVDRGKRISSLLDGR